MFLITSVATPSWLCLEEGATLEIVHVFCVEANDEKHDLLLKTSKHKYVFKDQGVVLLAVALYCLA